MSVYLTIVDRLGNLKRVELRKPVVSLGRLADCDLQILGSSVSRHHAEIVTEADGVFVEDKQSKGGTFVNDERITRQRLRHGDRIRLGSNREFELQFMDERYASAPPAVTHREEAQRPPAFNAHAELQNLARFLEVNQALKISLPINDVLQLIVDSAIEITRAERGALLLRGEGGRLEFRVARDRERRTLTGGEFPMSRTALEQSYREGRSLILGSLGDEGPGVTESVVQLDLRTIVCIPLLRFQVSERNEATSVDIRETVGVLYVDSREQVSKLTRASVTLLESLAFEASKALEGIRLMHLEAEKRRMEQELAMAREVQVSLLSTSNLVTEYADLAASSLPCRYVDGDFVDLFPAGEDRTGLVLGDVAGKGVSAALLASMAQGVLHTQICAGLPVDEVVSSLNRLLVLKSPSWRFITLFCGVLQRDGRFTYVNAGHLPPILQRATGETELLLSDSLVVGAFDSAVYSSARTRLFPGDVLVAFTDGVTEATGPAGEMFGDDRLRALIKSLADRNATLIRDHIVQEVASFTRGAPQDDDITVLAIKARS